MVAGGGCGIVLGAILKPRAMNSVLVCEANWPLIFYLNLKRYQILLRLERCDSSIVLHRLVEDMTAYRIKCCMRPNLGDNGKRSRRRDAEPKGRRGRSRQESVSMITA